MKLYNASPTDTENDEQCKENEEKFFNGEDNAKNIKLITWKKHNLTQEQQPQAHEKKFEVQKSRDKQLTNDVILKYCIDDWQGLLAHGWNETNRKE